jgi:hypothetical protein
MPTLDPTTTAPTRPPDVDVHAEQVAARDDGAHAVNPTGPATPADRREAGKDAYRASLATGEPMSGTELGRLFDRSSSWGRAIAAEVRAESNGNHGVDVLDSPGAASDGQAAASENLASPMPAPTAPALTPGVRLVTTLAVLAVAIVAAVVSFEHMRQLALTAGEGWRAWLMPVSVDGLVLSASMVALTRRRAGQPVGALAWSALLLGLSASVAANIAAAEPTLVGRAVASWPPLALGLSFELLLQLGRRQT